MDKNLEKTIDLLNHQMAEKAASQIKLNETREILRETELTVINFHIKSEDGLRAGIKMIICGNLLFLLKRLKLEFLLVQRRNHIFNHLNFNFNLGIY